MSNFKPHKVLALPTNPKPSSLYWVKPTNSSEVTEYVTDINGVPYPLKDLAGGGISSITNTDGNLVITGVLNKIINLDANLLSVINSALQSGDNISELLNDAGYITTANLPTKTSDLINDGEDGTTDFVETDELGIVAFSNDYNDLDNLPTIPTQYTDENAQDAVGNILTDSTTIDFNYVDGTPEITAEVKSNSITSNELANNINISEFINDVNYADETYVDNKIVQTITNGDTTHSPSSDIVFDKLLLKQNLPTGFVSGLQLSIHPTDNTKAIIATGGYIITDFSDVFNIQAVPVQISTPIEFTPAFLNTSPSTYVALDINGAIVSQASPFDNSQRRTLCLIGNVVHSNLTNINVVNEIKAPILAPTNQLHDLIRAVGFLNLEGNLITPNGANLSLNKSAGKIWGLGINGGDYLDPHRLSLPQQTALSFRYRLSVTPIVEFSDTILLDPTQYESSPGVLSSLSNNNKWSIQHLNIFQSGVVRIQYGQHEYNSFALARNAAFTESFTTEQNIADNAIFRCLIIMQKTCTNLQSAITTGDAEIIHIGKFGNAVGGSTAALTLANIIGVLGYTPENVANKSDSYTLSSSTTYSSTKALVDGIATKQDTLVSGTNIKTINGNSLLGSGNLLITSGSVITRKTTTSSSLSTQDLAGFKAYIDGVTSFFIAENEHVIYEIIDTGQKFLIYPNNRNVGSGETPLLITEIAEIERPLQTILERIGHWTKFNAGVSSNYPFVGGAINSGIVQSVNVTNVINAYGNAFVRFIAASGVANSGYRFSDGNNYPTTFFKGVTFFAVINPIVITNLSAIIGMPHSASISSATENTTTGAWFNITGTTIQAKCSYLSAVSLAPSQTITGNQWLLFMIEVVDNDATNKKIRFKVRQTDGTLVYNEEITSNIQPYNVFSNNMSSGCRAVLTSTPVSNTDIFGLNGMGFWGQKPNFLNNF